MRRDGTTRTRDGAAGAGRGGLLLNLHKLAIMHLRLPPWRDRYVAIPVPDGRAKAIDLAPSHPLHNHHCAIVGQRRGRGVHRLAQRLLGAEEPEAATIGLSVPVWFLHVVHGGQHSAVA